MTNTNDIRLEERNEAAALDAMAARTVDSGKADTMRWLADFLRRPIDWPVTDAERDVLGGIERHVVDELGALHVFDHQDEDYHRVPVRTVINDGVARIEIGPYDLDRKDISVLRRAIAAYDDLAGNIRYGEPLTADQLAEINN